MKAIKKQCDNLWSKLVKEKALLKCEYCGRTTTLNSHHVIGRSSHKFRYDLRNGCCLCALHHVFGNQSAHKNAIWFSEFFKSIRPDDWKYLKEHQNDPPVKLNYKHVLEDLKNN
jgi:hypothetical protein